MEDREGAPALEDTFEEPILELERRIEALSGVGDDTATQADREKLQGQLDALRGTIFSQLTPWQTTLVARHPKRRSRVGDLPKRLP